MIHMLSDWYLIRQEVIRATSQHLPLTFRKKKSWWPCSYQAIFEWCALTVARHANVQIVNFRKLDDLLYSSNGLWYTSVEGLVLHSQTPILKRSFNVCLSRCQLKNQPQDCGELTVIGVVSSCKPISTA